MNRYYPQAFNDGKAAPVFQYIYDPFALTTGNAGIIETGAFRPYTLEDIASINVDITGLSVSVGAVAITGNTIVEVNNPILPISGNSTIINPVLPISGIINIGGSIVPTSGISTILSLPTSNITVTGGKISLTGGSVNILNGILPISGTTNINNSIVPISGNATIINSVVPTSGVSTILSLPTQNITVTGTTKISFSDTPSVDSFSRIRTSSPTYLFDAQLTYDLQPLLLQTISSGTPGTTGATITYDPTNCAALMVLNSNTTGQAYIQSYEYFRYQPGRSQLIFMTFCMNGGIDHIKKFAGYSDGINGVEFQLSGTTPQFMIYSKTSNGNEIAIQNNWNLDTMDGNGPSRITMDFAKTQILVIDLQALYVGRVRCGFDIDGNIYYAHQFLHSNRIAYPYIQSANLPVRMGIVSTTPTSGDMIGTCMSVSSEAGQIQEAGYSTSITGSVTAGNGVATHALSVRPKLTFNSSTNRTKFILSSVDIVAGNNPISWQLAIGQRIAGTTGFNNVNTNYSAFEYNNVGTISGSPTLVISNGFIGSSAGNRGSISREATVRTPICLDALGNNRDNGTVSLILQGIGGTSVCNYALNWSEIR